MTYTIYHLPQYVHSNGRIGKVGCTSQKAYKRARQQNYTFNDFEVLEQYEDIYMASTREIELQKQYDYPVDKVPYYVTLENRSEWNDSKRHQLTPEENRRGIVNGGKASSSKYDTCPHCAITMKLPIIFRWHFDNCKHKKTLTN